LEEYLCKGLAIPDITINVKDAKQEGILRILVAKWNNKINATKNSSY
jgi:hypothetical protein